MAGEIQCDAPTGLTVYAQVRNSVGQIWNDNTFLFETYDTANIADYAILMAEQGTASGYYSGNMPALQAGIYNIVVHRRVGGSVAESDPYLADGSMRWNGTAVVSDGQFFLDYENLNLAANLIGSVGSVTGNIGGDVVGSVGSVTGNVGGNVAGSVNSVVSGVTLTSGERIAVGTAVWATVLWGTKTAAQWARWVAAALFGKVTGSGANYKDLGTPATTVLAVTDDGGGDRTVVLTDPP